MVDKQKMQPSPWLPIAVGFVSVMIPSFYGTSLGRVNWTDVPALV